MKSRKILIFLTAVLILCALLPVFTACADGKKSSYVIDVGSQSFDEEALISSLAEPKALALAKDGESDFYILLESDDELLRKDAEFLRDALRQMTGAKDAFEILSSPEDAPFISLGKTAFSGTLDFSKVEDDGYKLQISGGNIFISGNYSFGDDIGNDGTANGIYSFLENELGCMFVRDDYSYIPSAPTIYLDEINKEDNPDFVWRRIYQYEVSSSDWSRRIKSNGTGEKLDIGNDANRYWGTWCHSSFHFVDPDLYFEDHPEYYALLGGERRREAYGDMQPQLCLSAFMTIDGEKTEAFEIIKNKLAEDIAAYPDAIYWDFSINDGYHPCECEKCAAACEKYGSHAGLLLLLINALAQEFPDKMISTLAYQHMRTLPQGIKCEPNVNIVIAPIQTSQLYSYKWGGNDSSAQAKRIIEEWAGVCDNLFIWDYTVNFNHLLLPYPNLAVQKDNLEFYLQNNVRSIFHQGSREQGDEMACLRSYVLARQLWDADTNVNELLAKYVAVTYKDAAPYVAEYIDAMHSAVSNANDLDLYDEPSWHALDYLSTISIAKYQKLIASAKAAVKEDEAALARVEELELNVVYAKMFEPSLDVVGKEKAFERFCTLAEEQGIERIHEVKYFTDEFTSEIYPSYLKAQKIYLTLAVVLPVVLIPALTFLIVLAAVRAKKRGRGGKTTQKIQ